MTNPAQDGVTEAMVDAACKALWAPWDVLPDLGRESFRRMTRVAINAALAAAAIDALAVSPKPAVAEDDAALIATWRDLAKTLRGRLNTPLSKTETLLIATELERAADRLSALASAPVGVPPGYKIVPVEPTKEMKAAGGVADKEGFRAGALWETAAGRVYAAMLAAAPTPPSTNSETKT